MKEYKQDNITIHNADCMEIMSRYEDNYFDLAVTSPPYNMNLRVNSKGDGYCSRQIVKELSTKYKNYSDNLPMEDYYSFLYKTMMELVRVSKLTFFNMQMITGNKPAFFKVLGDMHKYIKECIIWDKGAAQPAIGKGVLNSQYEFIIVLSSDAITRSFEDAIFDRGTLSNLWQINKKPSKNKNHSASYPIELSDKILNLFCKKGAKVIDPFLGTGTSAISAHYAKMGEFVGCELDPDYYEASIERIYNETRQLELF